MNNLYEICQTDLHILLIIMILLDEKRISRTLRRMAYQIVEKAGDKEICLIGLNERGYSLAVQMKPVIESASSLEIPLFQLNAIDDSEFSFSKPINENQILVIVDDVIFSGSTMHRAIGKIEELSVFEKIYIAVLVDRGHRKYPLHAEIVGLHVPTKLNEEVELRLKKNTPKEVVLLQK